MPNGNYPSYNHDPLNSGAGSIRLESKEIKAEPKKNKAKKDSAQK